MRRTLWRAAFDDARHPNSLPLKKAHPGQRRHRGPRCLSPDKDSLVRQEGETTLFSSTRSTRSTGPAPATTSSPTGLSTSWTTSQPPSSWLGSTSRTAASSPATVATSSPAGYPTEGLPLQLQHHRPAPGMGRVAPVFDAAGMLPRSDQAGVRIAMINSWAMPVPLPAPPACRQSSAQYDFADPLAGWSYQTRRRSGRAGASVREVDVRADARRR